MRIKTEHVTIAGLILATFLMTALLTRRGPKPSEEAEKAETGESRSFGPTGLRAFYQLLAGQRIDVRRLERRFELIPAGIGVIAMVSCKVKPDDSERLALTKWVREGGTLLIFPSETTRSFCSWLGWTVEGDGTDHRLVKARLGDEHYDLNLSTLARATAREGMLADAEAIAQDELGWIAGGGRLGDGYAVVVTDPLIASNGNLLKAEHAEFMVELVNRLARGRPVAFDEYHHGSTGGQGLYGWIMSSAGGWALLQGLLALAFFVMAGRRLGPPRELHEERRRRPQEFIEAFARLCRKAGSRALALDLVLADVRDALVRRYGAGDAAVVRREADRKGRNGARLAAAYDEAVRASKSPSLNTAGLLRHQRLLDEVRSLTR